MKNTAIIIGDSFPNTLGIIRSLGEAKIQQKLILVTKDDWSNVRRSKYLHKEDINIVSSINDVMPILEGIKDLDGRKTIICSNDEAAEWVDSHESYLHKYFCTPTRGKTLGALFNKAEQCKLAEQCGLDVPRSVIYHKGDSLFLLDNLSFPCITKPLVSTQGDKSDIHICYNKEELKQVLTDFPISRNLIIQEFIEKEYEINCIGVRTEKEIILAGAVQKIRHWPDINGACSFGYFDSVENYNLNVSDIEQFMKESGYYGPFSIEFVHKGDKNYFMEVNFRNDGLAYTATCAGLNLHAIYVVPEMILNKSLFHPVFMMNTSSERKAILRGDVSLFNWIGQFRKTECFIDYNKNDKAPYIWLWIDTIRKKLKLKS